MDPISIYEKREELRRVLQSKRFAKAKKKSRFLEFVCEQGFAGNAEKLNEYLIGVEIYDRGTDFNPQDDPIVRVQAHQIRRSLKEYYEDEGRTSAWRIDFPSGHYVPVFTRAEAVNGASTTAVLVEASAPTLRARAPVIGLAILCLLFAVLFVRERYFRPPAAPSFVAAAGLSAELQWFWAPFLPPATAPLIVIPNHPLLRATHDGDSRVTLSRGKLVSKQELPEFRDTVHFRELKGFYFVPSTTDFTAVGETLGLVSLFELFGRSGQKFRVKASRLVDFEEVRRANTILLGGNQTWSGKIFLYPKGFRFHAGVIYNNKPAAGERPVYRPEFDPVTNNLVRDYALVLMLPNERRQERVLLIYGIYTQSSQAAIEYLTSADRLNELRQALLKLAPGSTEPPRYFQALLETPVENYVPGKASFVAARAIPH